MTPQFWNSCSSEEWPSRVRYERDTGSEMFGKKKRQAQQARAEREWEQLPPDDPFVQEFGQPGETFLNGVNAIDWTKRQKPGTARDDCECLLVLTNQRVLICVRDQGILEVAHERMHEPKVRTLGVQGFVTLTFDDANGPYTREFSMHAAMAPVFADRLRSYLDA